MGGRIIFSKTRRQYYKHLNALPQANRLRYGGIDYADYRKQTANSPTKNIDASRAHLSRRRGIFGAGAHGVARSGQSAGRRTAAEARQPPRGQTAYVSGQGQISDLPLYVRRGEPCGHLRSQTRSDAPSRQADEQRESRRLLRQPRQSDGLAVQVQKTWPVRDRGFGALPASGAKSGRPLSDALGLHHEQ